MNTENLGYAELVDTVADGIELAVKFGEALKDGFQFADDLPVLLGELGTINELIKDAPLAWAELKDLDVDETSEAMEALAVRLNAPEGSVIDFVEDGLALLAKGYILFIDARSYIKRFKKDAA